MAGVEPGMVPRSPCRALRRRARVDRGARARAAARTAHAQPRGALLHGFLETAADGLADVAYLELARPRIEVPADLPAFPAARRVPPPARRARVAPAPPAVRPRRGRRGARSPVRAARARDRRGGRHRDRLRPARRTRRLVARRRRGAPPAGGGDGRRRGRVRRRRLLPGRAAAAPAPARRRARDHRAQRPLRAGVAELALRPPGLGERVRHELRVPRLRAPLVDPGSGLRAPRRHARHRHPQAPGRAEGRLRRRLVGRRAAARRRSSTTRPTTRWR